MAIALFPLIKPTTWLTENLVGIAMHNMDMINTKMAFDYPAFALIRQFVEHVYKIMAQFFIQNFTTAFGNQDNVTSFLLLALSSSQRGGLSLLLY